MITRNMLRALAMATTCLAPMGAYAADTSAGTVPFEGSVGFGLLGIAGNNPNQAGRYDGLNTKGLYGGVFDLNWLRRDPWDSGGTRYYEIYGDKLFFQGGKNLGTGLSGDSHWTGLTNNNLVNEGSLGFRIGDQGLWGANVYYDAITYTGNVVDSLYTVNGNQGILNNGLAPWGGATATKAGATTAFTIPTLTATGAMMPIQTGTRRDIIGGDFKFAWGNWNFAGGLKHEHKEGSMEEAFYQPYGGMAFGLPINYDTDRYDASASYSTRPFQAIVQYTFSRFVDNNTFAGMPFPTSNTAVPFQRTVAYSTPPSNDAHYVTVMLAANDLIPRTRLNFNARVGLEMQNNGFAPNTADPTLAGVAPANLVGLNGLTQGTAGTSPNLMATVYQLKVSASSRPLRDLDTRIYYGLDGRNVNVDRFAVYTGGTGGGGADTTPGGASTLAYAVPQQWLKQNAGFEVGYRVLPAYDGKVTVGYRFDDTARSNAQVGHSWSNTGTIGLSAALGSQVDGKLTFAYGNRSGNLTYLGPWTYLGQGVTCSGAYYQAPMTSESVTFRADYTPTPALSGGFFLEFKNEDYNYPAATAATGASAPFPLTGGGQGIKGDYALVLGPDLNYRLNKNTSVHLFYTYELLFFNNTGNGACALSNTAGTANCAGSIGYFQNKQTSSTHTVGVSGEWQVNDKLKLKGDYTFSYGSVMFGQYNGVFVSSPTLSYQNVSNYPDINSLMHNVRLTATYQVLPNLELIGQAAYTYLYNNDWNDTANAIQGAGSSAISLLTPGYYAPKYSVVAVLAGARFRF